MINTNNPWRHKRKQTLYRVICVADQNPKPDWHAKDTVVFMGTDGHCWTRPLADFLDKFEEVTEDGNN